MLITPGSLSCPFTPRRPPDGVPFGRFSFHTRTTGPRADHPGLPPAYVLGAACDGQRGVFLTRDTVKPFFAAHQQASVILHNAAFDLKVTAPLLRPEIDLYGAVDDNRVWDTMILKRLLSLATVGHSARSECSLAD